MRKVLILSNSSSGLYEFRREILLDMLRDSEVYLSLPDMDQYYDYLGHDGNQMIHTPFDRRGMNPIKDIKLLRSYLRIIRDIRPDVICTYTIKPNIYGGIASRIKRIPYIVNITGLGTALQGDGILSKLLTILYKIATRRASCIFFQNEYNMKFMQDRGIAYGNARLLPGSGVNLEHHTCKPYPSEESGINILSVLRIMKDKGIEEYLRVVEELGGQSDGDSDACINFILAGNYEEETRDKYQPEIDRLCSENKLQYLGFRDDIDTLYEECHMVLHPSYHEGLSNVCLEAAASGRMVLASDIPGCRETLVNNISGYTFEAKSSEALKGAVERAIALSPDKRESMGLAGRNHVRENFDRTIVISKYRDVINTI